MKEDEAHVSDKFCRQQEGTKMLGSVGYAYLERYAQGALGSKTVGSILENILREEETGEIPFQHYFDASLT